MTDDSGRTAFARATQRPAALLAVLAVAVVALCGCTRTEPVVLAPAEYLLPDYGLSLRLPEGWLVSEGESGLRWQARPKTSARSVADVVPGVYFLVDRDLARDPAPGFPKVAPTLASYVERSEALAAKDWLRYRVVGEGLFVLDGMTARWHERAYANHTIARRSYAVFTVRGRAGYLLTGSALEADYPRWAETFRAIAQSARWLPEDPQGDSRDTEVASPGSASTNSAMPIRPHGALSVRMVNPA